MESRDNYCLIYVVIVICGFVDVGFHCGVLNASLLVFCFRLSLPSTLILSRCPQPSFIAIAFLGPNRLEPIALTLLTQGCRGTRGHSTSLVRRSRDRVMERNCPGSSAATNGRRMDGHARTVTVRKVLLHHHHLPGTRATTPQRLEMLMATGGTIRRGSNRPGN